ncbi:hypothetical protein [Burkholderia ambifaria]|uniref:hypothetical protein n=1 Tax=Burkholderia ambifaria TaxID=152480 RepID=UPI00158CE88D|nr:hypothetical protein [Burkholderia ambifaria]
MSHDNKVWNVSQLSLERTNLAHAQLEQEIIGLLYHISYEILITHKQLRISPMPSAFSA